MGEKGGGGGGGQLNSISDIDPPNTALTSNNFSTYKV